MKSGSQAENAGAVRQGLAIAGLSLLVLAGVSHEASATILIDDFTTATTTYPKTITADTALFTGTVETGLTGTIGGGRRLAVGNATMDVDGFDNASVAVFTSSPFSFFDYNSTVGTNADATLQYGNATSLPALNLNATGETTLRLDLLNYDGPTGTDLKISASITSSAGGGTFALPLVPVAMPGAQSVNISLASLSALTLGDIDGIQIYFDAPKSGDFRVDTVSLVPEPASAALFIGGLAPLVLRRRKN